ncbi:MAG: hypothetical protein CMB56_005640 [Methanobacteriota archaeon]|nr:MAG: hypothetical protein CMB56_005640 [Euryarchaeota archaeon]
MGLERLRSKWEVLINPLITRMGNVPPSVLTWSTIPLAILACYFLLTAERGFSGGISFILAFLFIILTGVFDGLDGTIARKYGKVSRYGDFLDHTIDRIVDIALILAISYNSNWILNPIWGWSAALSTLFGSYMGTQAQSVGLGRNYSGFGRADRVVVTLIGVFLSTLQSFLEISDFHWLGVEWNPMVLVIFTCTLGGIYTFTVRFFSAGSDLKMLDKQEPLTHTESTTKVDE